MKILNEREPRIDPCVTPSSVLHYSLKLLIIFTKSLLNYYLDTNRSNK